MDYLNKKTVKDIDICGKTVLLRCDFNVPLDEKGNIVDTRRIDSSLETINYILKHDAKLILCSHLGKPGGVYNNKLSLAPIASYLSKKLGKKVALADDVVGESAKNLINSLKSREICILENLRFESGEESNDPEFARKLASFADVCVNDAFGTCHRMHASNVGIASYIPCVCGFLVEKEIEILCSIFNSPNRPLVAILGGAKVSDKIEVIDFLLDKVDALIIGGGMSYTFMNALGYSVGKSICESEKISFAKDMMAKAKENEVKIFLPIDIKVAEEYKADSKFKIVDADKIPEGWMGLDIGPKTSELFACAIKNASTIIWNGPMGVYEWSNFESGTRDVAQAIAESSAVSVTGGGDSATAVDKFALNDKMSHISTGGGAFLRFLEGKCLPALEVLKDR